MLKVIPITFKAANEFITRLHRHHKPVVGCKFCIGIVAVAGDEGVATAPLSGVAVVGRPVARGSDDGFTAEVTRLCTDGTFNACSALYGAAARVAREMGFRRIQTYVLETELGTSLKASGWRFDGMTAGGQWKHTGGPRRTDQPTCPKQRWVKDFQ